MTFLIKTRVSKYLFWCKNVTMEILCLLKNQGKFLSTKLYKNYFMTIKQIHSNFKTSNICDEIQNACNHGQLKKAIQLLYSHSFTNEIKFTPQIYSCLLQTCINMRAIKDGKIVQTHMILTGSELDSDLKRKLMILYAKSGRLKEARRMFNESPTSNAVSWTTMISAYSQNKHYEEAIELFHGMRDAGIAPSKYTYASILPAFANLGRLEDGKKVHEDIVQKGLQSNVYVSTALVDMYVKCDCMDYARQLFDEMPDKSEVTWNTMIFGYVKEGLVSEARELFRSMPKRDAISWAVMISGYADSKNYDNALSMFRDMQKDGISPNSGSYTSLLPACRDLGDIYLGRQVHCDLIKHRHHMNVFVATALLDVYAKCGYMEDARKVFEGMTEHTIISWNSMISGFVQNENIVEAERFFDCMQIRNVVSWTVMIKGYTQNGDYEQALDAFSRMLRTGIISDEGAYSCVLPSCANSAGLNFGKEVHNDVIRQGACSNVFVANSLIDMYCKCGNLDDACKVFFGLPSKNVVSWTTMIMGYAANGQGEKAIDLFKSMQESGKEPDQSTFLGVLWACCHSGLVDEAKRLFVSMSQAYGISPGLEHYSCMVDVLGRAGLFVEVEEFILSMPKMPNGAVWGSLLSSCIIHNNIELGVRAADKVFELDPDNSANYVSLANMYAAAGRWEDAEKVRSLMKQKSIKKFPGCSWIEVDKKIYAFVIS